VGFDPETNYWNGSQRNVGWSRDLTHVLLSFLISIGPLSLVYMRDKKRQILRHSTDSESQIWRFATAPSITIKIIHSEAMTLSIMPFSIKKLIRFLVHYAECHIFLLLY
jgi:hypothetical protein